MKDRRKEGEISSKSLRAVQAPENLSQRPPGAPEQGLPMRGALHWTETVMYVVIACCCPEECDLGCNTATDPGGGAAGAYRLLWTGSLLKGELRGSLQWLPTGSAMLMASLTVPVSTAVMDTKGGFP